MDGNNRFGPTERAMLLGVKGVGPTVIGGSNSWAIIPWPDWPRPTPPILSSG